ncbi:predicted protein [Naegleria gruberi]|uniref:Predicted protein n=1 Tax=Naegleria gruberi TaxID=5762 RepID=D2VJX1_NAEGR|nr:uncharacterized protein NAEGRDRAFT_69191 [Naegleria gruberi]EFC42764.1 predicted protein [Naegleria gruberi]|eukprot:XP_002675508.1 predicted protein [Naegleria gruberi strain NEG-M]
MNANHFNSLLNKVAEGHFNRKITESKVLKTFLSVIRMKIKNNFDSLIGKEEENEEMERILHSFLIDEIGDVNNIIYTHSLIIRSKHSITNVEDFFKFLTTIGNKYNLLELLFLDDLEHQWAEYDMIVSDYEESMKAFVKRNLPFNPSSIETVVRDNEQFDVFEQLVNRWFPNASNKLLIDGLIYSMMFYFSITPSRKDLVLQVGILPQLPSFFDKFLLLMCYCKNFEMIPSEKFKFILKFIIDNNPFNNFSDLMNSTDTVILTKLFIKLGIALHEKMDQTKLEELTMQISTLSENLEKESRKNLITREEVQLISIKLAGTEEELRLTREKLEEELRLTKEKLQSQEEELRVAREKLFEVETELALMNNIMINPKNRELQKLASQIEALTQTIFSLLSQQDSSQKECARKSKQIEELEGFIVEIQEKYHLEMKQRAEQPVCECSCTSCVSCVHKSNTNISNN